MGDLIRSKDWSRTPLGPVEGWPLALRMVVDLMMANRFPMILWWGPEFIQLYNDPYRPIPGDKHPRSLGQPASQCWAEIWHVIGPLVETPFRGGPATWMEDIHLEIRRHGFVEETHFTIAYSPVPDDTAESGIGGVLATVHEITGKVVGDRRVLALRDLGTRSAGARTAEEACALAAQALGRYPSDIPFALLYLVEPGRKQARLSGAAGVKEGHPACPSIIALEGPESEQALWPLGAALRAEAMQIVPGLAERLGSHVPPGPWTDPPHTAVVVPIASSKAHHLAGFLVAGVSSRLRLDGSYRDFLELVATQISTGITSAREYEEEKKRAEALAELDRAKTVFFSNVSHEFRTPLTLVLGPLEDLLGKPDRSAPPEVREAAAMARRNALRLLKLVNNLLDFSRIEAGRIDAVYEPTDLSALTADLASNFRSAVDRAGMELVVDCPPLAEPVHVDRDMWEKIVLNLLSNAFKFTLEGRIAVELRSAQGQAVLRVIDTGTGIPTADLPHLFERFHRVKGARARTHEGTGIGLALVQELVRLHGGTVSVESEVGRGSTFTVRLPLGSAHLPEEKIGKSRTLASTALGSGPFVEEALRWLPGPGAETAAWSVPPAPDSAPAAHRRSPAAAAAPRPRIVLADDNSDMRDYIERLLAPSYEVHAVADGGAALSAARRERPDLVLTDVMMPVLDGLALLRELRSDPDLRTVPVIVLSARAGEEARIEGLDAGADDYLAKPFGARELLARVGAQIELSRVRREAAEALLRAKQQLEEADRRKDHFLAVLSHELRNPLTPVRNSLYVLDRAPPGSDKARRAREVMERQIDQLSHLVDDLLDVTRIARGKIHLQRRRIELNELASRTLEDHRFLFERSQLQVDLEPWPGPVLVHADWNRIAQVLSNLLQNAAKFTPPGGRVKLAVEADAPAGSAVLRVTDTGAGLAPEMLARLFEPFMQADETLDRSKGGLGLGLALVNGLVEQHGGTVAARSDGPGRGAELTVRLPLDPGPETRVEHGPTDGARVRRRVLLIEDNSDAADSLREVLELDGHEVAVAHDGPRGLAKAREIRPDVVFCDIGLPGMDGYAVARAFRADAALLRTHLVALSGYALPEDLQLAADAGFDRHLAKPPSLEKLDGILRDLRSPPP
jgi:signal transduction histidine kinase